MGTISFTQERQWRWEKMCRKLFQWRWDTSPKVSVSVGTLSFEQQWGKFWKTFLLLICRKVSKWYFAKVIPRLVLPLNSLFLSGAEWEKTICGELPDPSILSLAKTDLRTNWFLADMSIYQWHMLVSRDHPVTENSHLYWFIHQHVILAVIWFLTRESDGDELTFGGNQRWI